ncbi:peptide-methionine (S)-S-oxide reductase MsrA [Sphingosinicella soli]|uniref:Peptide methionine sulfoxide reductase MsrA n=1 Tax=Sphingosinicella soli TaxID=333708 RepID=A0A7W7B0D5_9SPHN|nr:peptide-methionine (S)-S-oxide reductase MsrA [Sphingosinicella soli]MBB4631723.1 peptide-methionine (S)-S-oxide reductase [Sphingosinicella soli]
MKRAAALALIVAAGFAPAESPRRAEAIFAMGCFWSAEAAMEKQPGVITAVSGFAGGHVKNPTYRQVTRGGTGHLEAVRVVYDPRRTSYAKLLDAFWHNIDPFDPAGQFCDKGAAYQTAVFAANADQRTLAEGDKARIGKRFGKRVATDIRGAATFYPAEAYHQDFAKRNARHYGAYRSGCGQDRRLKAIWG